MATIMRDGNWTKFGQGGRWHYTPPYAGPRNDLAPYRGKPITQHPSRDLREYGDPRKGPGGVLPGPGPQAGGRYRWSGPQTNLGRPTAWKDQWRKAQWWHLGRSASRLSPVGRAVDIGFQLMDLWQVTQEEGWPLEQKGWVLNCRTGIPPGVINGIRWVAGYTPISCDLSNVHTASNATINKPTIPASATTVFFGQFNSSGTRINHLEKWTIFPAPVPAVPIPWQPRITQPMPGTATPPEPAPDQMGRPRSDPRTRRKPMPSLAGRPRTKPSPYYPNPPSTPVKTLPKPGEEKWVLRDPWIGDFYGKLTEVKDALKCIEKNTKGYRPKGGLFARMANLSGHIYRNPHSVDWRGVGDCLVANQIEDAVIGKVNQLANQITKSPYWVRPVGVGRGGFAVRMT